jgi:hypothetical protein
MMTAGKALSRDNVAGFNCCYAAVDHPHVFDEILYILACGTGVGFSVESDDVKKLPTIPDVLHSSDSVIVVPDSKIGWATSLRELISMLYAGKVPNWDLSRIRKKGARLKTFGGRASGPDPLRNVFEFVVRVFKDRAGGKLRPIDCHDIVCKIAECIVVGGVRRSALISLSDLSDNDMRHCKSGNWWEKNGQRSLANNSAVYNDKPSIGDFMDEWASLYRSGSGERGINNRYSAVKNINSIGRRDGGHRFGTNPCCVPADCPILTKEGYIPIGNIIGKSVEVWNGLRWSSVVPFHAGKSILMDMKFSDGSSLKCTPNHKFVLSDGSRVPAAMMAIGDKLMKFDMPVVGYDGDDCFDPPIDAYSQGFYSGDGCKNSTKSSVYSPKYPCIPRLIGRVNDEVSQSRRMWNHGHMFEKSFVPTNASLSYKLNWIAGLFDADGCVTRDKNGNGIQLVSVDLGFLEELRLMLTTVGIRAKIIHASDEGMYPMPDGRGGTAEYFRSRAWRILIGNSDTCRLVGLGVRFNRLIVHGNPPQRDARQFVKLSSVSFINDEVDVYCFTDQYNNTGTFNGIVTGQSEILLRPFQFCNLTSVQMSSDDGLESMARKVRLATIMGTIQASLTDFRYLRKIYAKNTAEEALLGVSISGICDNVFFGDYSNPDLPQSLEFLRRHAIDVNAEFSDIIGINPSTAITCVKPEGTTSQASNRASGIHPRHSPFYIRTVRADSKDPLAIMMKDIGFPCEPDVMRPDSTLVFSFPIQSPKGCRTRSEMTAIDQLELWMVYKKHWAEHTVSITVSVRDHEWLDVAAWVYNHFDDITGISFLPYSEHIYKQAPYQECTELEYEEFLKRMPVNVDWSKLSDYEHDDETTGSQELACAGSSCELT